MKFYLLSVVAALALTADGFRFPANALARAGKETLDVTNKNIWESIMPDMTPTMELDESTWEAGKVYQLTCKVSSIGTPPTEYNVHYISKTLGKSLGYYNVKSALKATEFTANAENILASGHLVLEQEKDPKFPTYLLIKPSAADAYSCRVEVPNKKHPYYNKSDEKAQTAKTL